MPVRSPPLVRIAQEILQCLDVSYILPRGGNTRDYIAAPETPDPITSSSPVKGGITLSRLTGRCWSSVAIRAQRCPSFHYASWLLQFHAHVNSLSRRQRSRGRCSLRPCRFPVLVFRLPKSLCPFRARLTAYNDERSEQKIYTGVAEIGGER